ncbi:MAG: peptide MFS transporter [Alphaproteobacteria bacterium]|nr:peptide MFS transporter [Alphaproteobacteria bacterium]
MTESIARRDTVFLGHPSGLGWLSGTEFWERFSYYGMANMLTLYLVHQLLLPGHIEHVGGMDLFRRLLGGGEGQALAAHISGFYQTGVYLTPLLGGFLADRYLGKSAAVITGALMMAVGHFLMAFDVSFVLALLFLLCGIGLFKGNIAAQVGDLYAEGDKRRADGFQIYYIGIQLAGIITPFVCGTLGETVGWHWGFGAAGVGMVIGGATYLVGKARGALPAEKMRGGHVARPPLTARDKTAMGMLALLVPILALSLVGNQELFNAYLVWSEKNFQLVFFGKTMPVTWLLSLDTVFSAVLITVSVLFWRWYARHWREPDEVGKMCIAIGICATAPLTLALASATVARTGQPVSLTWALAFHLLNDLGFSNLLPVGLALYSRAAPKGWDGVMIAIYYLQFATANAMVGYLAGLLGTMPGFDFWMLHVGIMLVSGVLLLLIRKAAGKALAPG